MLEGRNFVIYTDHKPLIFAFKQNLEKCTPRQYNHLNYISQFTKKIYHISEAGNIVADMLSRVESISLPVCSEKLLAAQNKDKEL